jgi:hypothetical protein
MWWDNGVGVQPTIDHGICPSSQVTGLTGQKAAFPLSNARRRLNVGQVTLAIVRRPCQRRIRLGRGS